MTYQPYTSPSHPTSSGVSRTSHWSAAQIAAAVVGAAFLIVGVAGFIPGITENVDDIKFAGHESSAELLGIFQVSVLHNFVHLLFGVIGFAAATRHRSARSYLIAGGIVYLALWLYGLATDHESDANFVPLNNADDWLHLGLGAGMVLLGALLFKHDLDHDVESDRMVRERMPEA